LRPDARHRRKVSVALEVAVQSQSLPSPSGPRHKPCLWLVLAGSSRSE
jgi:hypothetical protein